MKAIAAAIGPTAALTALMYYFGLLHAYWFLRTFGVDYTVMKFTTQDYLLRSADGLFVPLTTLAVAVLATAWIVHPAIKLLLRRNRKAGTWIAGSAAVLIGSGLLALAAVGIADPAGLEEVPTLPGLGLSCGILCLTAAAHLYRNRANSKEAPTPEFTVFWEWSAVFLLVVVGLFWAAADYSASVGSRRGEQVLESLASYPDIALYTEKDLSISAPGVTRTDCKNREAAFKYRYDGLKLIMQSGDQYLFVPSGWSASTGTAVIVPRSDAIRLDTSGAAQMHRPAC
ncbi:hypothetical protein MUY14_01445 [Amycolatopsis sp. FBCC-B4732]|uniref:hypothetical protein n=1 Tax=Amycolatopsis sp. FBCC-B4732 TaxID=3079339 RepID=UPI001FF33D1D|nr:hypothetical protein [Amycolatopsis sp. FBCC-B4732]UOX89336.1 hypothetical protein MUY14_01445 [Amycolatopsis sp. FBCC-B4732]